MKSILAAALGVALSGAAQAAPHPFDVHDLVMMERVSDPALSPDGKTVAFAVRQTDYDANKGRNSVWVAPASGGTPKRLTDTRSPAFKAREWIQPEIVQVPSQHVAGTVWGKYYGP